jgi:hypothetical protein
MVTKQRQKKPGPKHPEQEEQNLDQRKRTDRPGEANIDGDNSRSSQQTGRRRERGEPEAVEGEGETESESAKL